MTEGTPTHRRKVVDSFEWLVEDDITCAVCLDVFNDPVTLNCAHNFCEACIQVLNSEASNAKSIVCPLCRVETSGDPSSFPRNTRLGSKAKRFKDANAHKNNVTPAAQLPQKIHIPRNIKLLEEYDASIGKGARTYIPDSHCGYVGYGLDEEKASNETLTYWRAMIIGPQESPIGAVIYILAVIIPEKFPVEPPNIQFVTPRLKMDCVDKTGKVNVSMIERVDMSLLNVDTGVLPEGTGEFFVWDESKNIADVLVAIRENMHIELVASESSSCGGAYSNYGDDEDNEDEEENDNENNDNDGDRNMQGDREAENNNTEKKTPETKTPETNSEQSNVDKGTPEAPATTTSTEKNEPEKVVQPADTNVQL